MERLIKYLSISAVFLFACQPVGPEDIIGNMPKVVVDSMGIEWTLVEAGWFTMGAETNVADAHESPVHDVYLSDYYISKHEVSNARFCEFLNVNGNEFEGHDCVKLAKKHCDILLSDGKYFPAPGKDNFPAVEVTWYGAKGFCQWAGGRLPTEAEWEKAARGTDARTYPWGENEPTTDYANYLGLDRAAKIGSYPSDSSAYGCLDMAGNVSEWCSDWYQADYYAESPDTNPEGPAWGSYTIKRGGNWWIEDIPKIRCSFRDYHSPYEGESALGFRVVKDSI